MADSYFFRVLVIPASVFLSVVFGGSYGSDREVVEFISRHGAIGGFISITAVLLVWAVVLFLSFEIARKFQAFDYRSFFKVLLGRVWFLYEIVIMIGLVMALAITATVAGTVMEEQFHIEIWVGTLMLLLLVIGLNYLGRKIIEQSMMFSVLALFLILVVLMYYVFSSGTQPVSGAFSNFEPDWWAWKSGIKYAITNVGYLPLLLSGSPNAQ